MIKTIYCHIKLIGFWNTIQAILAYKYSDYDSLKEFLEDDISYSLD